jgi:hypothetical protein
MADQPTEKPEAVAPALEATAPEAIAADSKPAGGELAAKADAEAQPAGESKDESDVKQAPAETEKKDDADAVAPDTAAAPATADEDEKKPENDVEMKDAPEEGAAGDDEAAPADTSVVDTPAAKSKARRKSTAGESKAKTLSKKGSKARLTHTDAKPGDHFLVKLKGFPAWPAIICDESMLPLALINSRPVTAAKSDGTYAEAYADGGKRVNDRTFPVMYLSTNEFGWVSNTALSELTPEKAKDTITDKMRKDLRAAFDLAIEHNSIDYYKDILKKFEEDLAASAAAAATPKKSKKGKSKADETDDLDMDMDDVEEGTKSAKSKKRKAEDDAATPQRPDSVKKPKIKLNTSSTPKTANGAPTPKSKTDSAVKPKSKAKKAKEGDKKSEAAKEVKMTPEERHARKEKEVLYLRHKLQRGLLTRDQQPQETEMKQMSDFIQMLENFADLEVSIIRATKINKVLKAILKLDSIPREDEFHFKNRSQALLDKWTKLLAGDGAPAAISAPNGVNGTTESTADDKASGANGVKEDAEETKTEAADADAEPKTEADAPESDEKDKSATEAVASTEAVEATT